MRAHLVECEKKPQAQTRDMQPRVPQRLRIVPPDERASLERCVGSQAYRRGARLSIHCATFGLPLYRGLGQRDFWLHRTEANKMCGNGIVRVTRPKRAFLIVAELSMLNIQRRFRYRGAGTLNRRASRTILSADIVRSRCQ